MFKLLLISLMLAVATASYCDLCSGHIACGHSGDFDPSCPADRQLVSLSQAHIEAFLHNHNTYRSRIANGDVPGFQPARRMATMSWSNELAFLAELNVKQCQMRHDSCRNTELFRFAGQNLGWRASSPNFESVESVIDNVVSMWWNEVSDASQPDIDRCCGSVSGRVIGHFTQLVTDRAIQVGCAISRYSNDWRNSLVACNYAFTNLVGASVYASGPPASGCTTGPNPHYTSLCSIHEQISASP